MSILLNILPCKILIIVGKTTKNNRNFEKVKELERNLRI